MIKFSFFFDEMNLRTVSYKLYAFSFEHIPNRNPIKKNTTKQQYNESTTQPHNESNYNNNTTTTKRNYNNKLATNKN